MTLQEQITPKTHKMTRWLDVDAPVDFEEGSIYRSRYSKDYAIIELTGDDQQTQWIAMKVYTTYEQQQEMHYDGVATYDISVRPRQQSQEETTCYRFTEFRSLISANVADQLLKEYLDKETKHLIDREVALVISQLHSLADAASYREVILERIQQSSVQKNVEK